jgi:hypothetical protein
MVEAPNPRRLHPQPWHVYAKCFSRLRCCGWAYGYVLVMLYYMCWWGWILGKWGMAETVWCCSVMVEAANPHWLHPTSILDVYKVFEHLEMLWMGIWVRTYAVLHVQVGVNFRKNGEWPSLYDVAVSCLRLQTPKDCIPQPYWMYKCVWAAWYAVDGHMGTYLCRFTCAGRGGFEGKRGMAEPVWCCGVIVVVEAANPHWLHFTSILYVYKVFEHLQMLWMGIWVYPYRRITCAGGGEF